MIKLERYGDSFYAVFRIFVGLLFMQHGLQKLFGLIGGNAASAFSLMWFAGLIEFAGGLLIAVGLFTRIVSFIAGVEMLVAYFKAHFPQGWVPIMNRGELALLFFAAFLVLMSQGAKKWSFDSICSRNNQ
ncbi:MAG: DoxX family protein [Candidatus Woesearchaeota archaeon]